MARLWAALQAALLCMHAGVCPHPLAVPWAPPPWCLAELWSLAAFHPRSVHWHKLAGMLAHVGQATSAWVQDKAGRKVRWGNTPYDLVYGPQGWCTAAQPKHR